MSISKECADFLRAHLKANLNQKLQASHAREIVAAFFGYKSHAAQLAEASYPLSAIGNAPIMLPDVSCIERRLAKLNGLPPNLPSSRELARILSDFIETQSWFSGRVALYDSLDEFVPSFLIENDYVICEGVSGQMADTNASFLDYPDYEEADITEEQDGVYVAVTGTLPGTLDYERPYSGDQIRLEVVVTLPRAAGRTCFGRPDIQVSGEIVYSYI